MCHFTAPRNIQQCCHWHASYCKLKAMLTVRPTLKINSVFVFYATFIVASCCYLQIKLNVSKKGKESCSFSNFQIPVCGLRSH